MKPIILATLICAAGSSLHAAAPAKLDLAQGEHIAIIGNTLADRMQHDGTLEAFVHKAFPQLDISIRNLGFAADEVASRMRSDDVPKPEAWLTQAKADVVFAFWGFNESFGGYEGLEKFKGDLEKFIRETKAARYNGKSAPRLVLFSPIAQEKMADVNLPDPEKNNTNLQNYTTAMAEVAKANDVQFVDLYAPSLALYKNAKKPLTHNGIHLTLEGYQALAPVIYKAVFGAQPPVLDEKLRAAVQVKNEMWLSRYRTVDQFNIFGGRSTIGYESGKGGPKVDNRAVLWPELSQRDVMTENREKRVWALAKGGDLKIDDSNIPPVPVIKSNKPGPNADGSYTYLGAEEAIKHMTVPKGVKVELVASEEQFPELVSPVQMAWDTKGRLWVSAWKNYPERTPTSKEGDKLLVFDIGADGKATKCTTFYDDLNCPTGFQFYKDGVVVMRSPDLLFLRDTDGDGKGELQERLLDGLDAADSHHETNSMAIEPGGAIYLSDGVFHRTQVETAAGPVRNQNGALYRWEPRSGKFERYIAHGFANPHGKVFDYWGNDLITDATGNENFFAPAFSGHIDYPGSHPSMKQFWNRPSRPCPGTQILSSRAWPEEFQNNFLNCNVISIQGIFRAKLSEDGSGIKGETLEHLITSDDPNFRPSGITVAPDGSLYFMDWHKPLIGHLQHHLRDPNREMDHGRIYRLTFEGMPLLKPAKIAGEPIEKLLELLKEPENNVRDRAKIELGARDTAQVMAAVDRWVATLDPKDAAYEHHLTEALWVKQYHNVVDPVLLKKMLGSPDFHARFAATRVLCYQRDRVPQALEWLRVQAADVHPRVRLEAVRAASFFTQWEAADVALTVLKQPTDYYIDYCLGETMAQLQPWWKKAVSDGQPIGVNNPAGIDFLLSKVSTPDLSKLPKTPGVYMAMLRRDDADLPMRMEALDQLSKANKTSHVTSLLDALEAGSAQGGKSTADLSQLLLSEPASELKAATERLRKLSTGKVAGVLRESAGAALIVANGSLDALWIEALKSPAALTDLLNALPRVPDAAVRATAYEKVQPLLGALPANLQAALSQKGASKGRYVRIELPRKGTLTLAEVEVYSDGANIAGSGVARQSSTGSGGEAKRAIDGNHNGVFGSGTQTHTNENEDHPWWELDLKTDRAIEAISIWNRSEENGQYAARLEGFELTVLDSGRNEVFKKSNNPAPKESVKVALEGDPAGALQRAAIRALVSTGREPGAVFGMLVKLIENKQQSSSAAQAIMALPRTAWDKVQAETAVNALVAWAGQIPAANRTAQDYIETVQVANELASLLPGAKAGAARKSLRDLGVSVYVIKTVREQMRYDTPRLVVEAGKPFEIIFENRDAMPHNLVFVTPGSRQAVAEAVQTSKPDQLDGQGRAYVPKNDAKVFAATKLVEPGQQQKLQMSAPVQPGTYEYVCTFPGHWAIMWGELVVVPDVEAYLQAHPAPVAR